MVVVQKLSVVEKRRWSRMSDGNVAVDSWGEENWKKFGSGFGRKYLDRQGGLDSKLEISNRKIKRMNQQVGSTRRAPGTRQANGLPL